MVIIPESKSEEIKVYNLKAKRPKIISDIHFQFHDKQAVEIALEYEADKCDCLILNGDILDFYQLSRFKKRPDLSFMKDEIEIAKEFITSLRKTFPNYKIVFKEGNHEFRLDSYICEKAPALYGIEEIQLKSLLKLKENNIDFVSEEQFIKCGSLYIIHGHETKGVWGTINVARQTQLKVFKNVLMGHWHRTQEYVSRDIADELIGSWSVGCLCGLKPKYFPHNNWNHGFAIVDVIDNKNFVVHNKKIIKNGVY